MQQATVHETASAFRQKTVGLAPASWTGRINRDEMARPGGLLMAALSQCAEEQGLSLSGLASTLGVSYWSLSQLRIGFRPIASLDDDLAQACAGFLDLPPLSIQMLAGLLDPAQALSCEDVSGEDILHARQMLSREPDELVLLPPPSRARPLQGLTVDELSGLHRAYAGNPAVSQALRAELNDRPMSKTELLRQALGAGPQPMAEPVEAPDETAPAPGILRCACCQKRLRIPHLPEPGEIRCPGCQTEYAVHWQAAICLVQRLENESAHADEDQEDVPPAPASQSRAAWAVLGLAENSPWHAVEQARRSLLQQYHPDRLGHVSPLVHKLAEDAFKRVSDAYSVLKAQR